MSHVGCVIQTSDYFTDGDVRTIKCRYCGDHINDKHEFRKHMNRHKDVEYKPWKCPICHYRGEILSSTWFDCYLFVGHCIFIKPPLCDF